MKPPPSDPAAVCSAATEPAAPSAATPEDAPRRPPPWVGAACGLGAAVGYALANACLRGVSHCDPVWVSAVKAVPTVLVMAPWAWRQARRGEAVWPGWRIAGLLAAAGLVAHLGGNVVFQWSLGVVGIALAASLTLGGMIVGGAALGRVLLGEGLTPRALVAMLLLLAAIAVLAVGAREASATVLGMSASKVPWRLAAAGVAASLAAGVVYALLGVAIRHGVNRGALLSATLLIVGGVGMLSLGALAWGRMGLAGMAATAAQDWLLMAGAGVLNAAAFLALTRALQLTNVWFVNALQGSQAAMCAAIGVLLFREPLSWLLACGVGLTIVGLLAMRKSPWRRGAAVTSPAIAERTSG